MTGERSYAARVQRAATWCLDHPAPTALFAAFSLAVAVGGATVVQLDPSPEAYLAGSENWAFYNSIEREYEIGETVVIALREAGGTVFDVETVSAVAELDRILVSKPSVERVLSIASATALARDDEVVDLRPLLPNEPITQANTIQLGDRVQAHSVYSQLLVDDRAETTYVFVQLASQDLDSVGRIQAARELREEADRFASKSRTVHLAGSAVTKEAIAAGIGHDTLLFFPAALILLTVLLWIMLGDLIASLIPLAVVGYSSTVVVCGLAFLGTPLNMATATVPTIILVVGIADSVHFLTELKRQFAKTGNRRASIIATVEAIAVPCLLTTATSAVGFLALVSSDVPPLREFGYTTALGLLVAYGSSMLLTPALLMVFRYPRAQTRAFPAAPVLGRSLSRFSAYAYQRLFLTVGISGLIFGGCVAAIAHLQIESDFIRYLDEHHRLRHDIAVIERTLGGTDVIEVVLDSPTDEHFKTPEGVKTLDRLARKLRRFDGVTRVFSLADYLELANSVMTGRRGIPESSEAVAQLALLDPTAFSALTNDDMTQARVSMQVRSMASADILTLSEVAKEATALTLEGTDITARFTGTPLLFAQIVRNLVDDAAGSFGIAAMLIFLAMLIGLRSPAIALVAMVPNVLTVGMTFGTMTLIGMSFDTNTAFVACLGIGIAVDNTIHIITRYQRARAQGSPTPFAAVQYAITHAGYPVVLTSLLLAVGFSVLCFSSFKPTFRVGLLSAILVAYAVVIDLLLLPVLLVAADKLEKRYEDAENGDPLQTSV